MTLDVMTSHEAEQKASLKKPLWPIYSVWPHCHGPCDRGDRLCLTPELCQTNQHDDEDEELSRFGAFHATRAVLKGLAVIGVLGALLAVAMGWRP